MSTAVTLRLGVVDAGAKPQNAKAFLLPFHALMSPALQNKGMLRDESNSVWRPFTEVTGTSVWELQEFLRTAGFSRRPDPPGVFAYRTHSALRLFQEYVRSVEKEASIGTPDGVAGIKVQEHIRRWKAQGINCKWSKYTPENPSPEYVQWFEALRQVKEHFESAPSPVVQAVEKFKKPSDTLKMSQWSFDPSQTHLIGIRRNHDIPAAKRPNDDLFVLLISGMVFKFWGSTDPSPAVAKRSDEAYLVEGQHLYRFGWHGFDSAEKIYRALRPASVGVLVFRDRTANNALTAQDIAAGVEGPNSKINIHWSGIGSSNFSAGCQVIAGESYINHAGETISCRSFAARSYEELAQGKTRGAYNLITDLVLSYTPPEAQHIRYTLGREAHLGLTSILGVNFATDTLKKLQQAV